MDIIAMVVLAMKAIMIDTVIILKEAYPLQLAGIKMGTCAETKQLLG
mgnify:CR=1 FL=1|jgi:hypothetical protein